MPGSAAISDRNGEDPRPWGRDTSSRGMAHGHLRRTTSSDTPSKSGHRGGPAAFRRPDSPLINLTGDPTVVAAVPHSRMGARCAEASNEPGTAVDTPGCAPNGRHLVSHRSFTCAHRPLCAARVVPQATQETRSRLEGLSCESAILALEGHQYAHEGRN